MNQACGAGKCRNTQCEALRNAMRAKEGGKRLRASRQATPPTRTGRSRTASDEPCGLRAGGIGEAVRGRPDGIGDAVRGRPDGIGGALSSAAGRHRASPRPPSAQLKAPPRPPSAPRTASPRHPSAPRTASPRPPPAARTAHPRRPSASRAGGRAGLALRPKPFAPFFYIHLYISGLHLFMSSFGACFARFWWVSSFGACFARFWWVSSMFAQSANRCIVLQRFFCFLG